MPEVFCMKHSFIKDYHYWSCLQAKVKNLAKTPGLVWTNPIMVFISDRKKKAFQEATESPCDCEDGVSTVAAAPTMRLGGSWASVPVQHGNVEDPNDVANLADLEDVPDDYSSSPGY